MNVAIGDSPPICRWPLADSPHRGHQGAPANGGGRCWVAGRGHAPPEGGCGRWPARALPRWLPFLVKQVLKQTTTCFRTALKKYVRLRATQSMIGEALYHDTTPTRGARDGRCVEPRQQQQPDMPLTQEPSKTCSSRSANAILDRIQPVEDLDACSGTLKLASV
jgi:hypothetical protein